MKEFKSLLLQNHILAGIVIGLLAALGTSGLLWFLNKVLIQTHYLQGYIPLLLAIAINLIIMRFYFLRFKLEKTGRGILLVTFIIALVFFIFLKEKESTEAINRIFSI